MKRLCILINIILIGIQTHAIDLNFKHYRVEDGLSSNSVHTIIQDSQGFIWIGTEDGINRFDGYEFRHFRNIPRDTTSIINNYVYVLYADSKDRVWAGTEEGICIYNLHTNKFNPFTTTTSEGLQIKDRIRQIISGGNDDIWISTYRQGVFCYDHKTQELKNYFYEDRVRQKKELLTTNCIYKDSQGTLWASVNDGQYIIYKFNPTKDVFEPAFPWADPRMLRQLSSHAILEDSFGVIWLGTWNNGLFALDKKGNLKGHYLHTANVDKILHIHSITEYEPGKLLIGSNDGLTSLIGSPSMGYKREVHLREPVLSNCFVYPIYKDREGGLWIGTYYGGINYASPNRNYFTGYVYNKYENSVSGSVISAFCEDADGNLWIGTDDGGLNYFNTKTEHFTAYTPDKIKNSISYHNIHALCLDGNDLWIGTYSGGLNVMNLTTHRFRYYYSNPADSTTLDSDNIYSLFKDSEGDIWVGTMSGINLYNRYTDSFRRMIAHDKITSDILQRGDEIWFATIGEGLYCYNQLTTQWKHYTFDAHNLSSLISNSVISLCLDGQDRLWIGTNSGLCYFVPETEAFIKTSASFRSDAICNIFCEGEHLWLTTTRGLIDYDPRTERHRLFTKGDGLTSEQFTTKSGIQTSSGKIYVGTTNGFNAFYPKQLVTNHHIPQIAITDFQLFNQSVRLDEYLQQDEKGQMQITLPYNKNAFGFDYTALSFYAPEKNEYAFCLVGFDKKWNQVDKKRKATYTNIPPGVYYFKVKASNNDGLWNEEGVSIKIIITPPFWLTNWFIIIYFVLVVLALIGIYLYIKRYTERKNNAKIEKIKNEQEKEAYDSKINFFTSIAHEIRTPVSLIIGPLEQIIAKASLLPEKIREELTIIDRNSQRLLTLVNQLLDFRKIEQGTIQLTFSEQNIHELLLGVFDRFKPYVESKNIRFVYTCDNKDLVALVDAENLTKVVSNLLNNASKFTKDYMELALHSQNLTGQFEICVTDNGIGIPKDQQDNIFKPFFQVQGSKQQRGTGLGLHLVKSIVDGCQGSIEIESDLGQGTKFSVFLPLDETFGQASTTETDGKVYWEEYLNEDKPVDNEEPENRELQNLLIVEDNIEMIDFLKKNFSHKFRVIQAENGVEGLKMLEKNEIALIISDIMMPEMDGITFCNIVKNNFLWSHIPLILLTAKTNMASRIEALNIGADAYLEKPFSLAHLNAQVKNLLESREKLLRKFTDTPYTSLKSIAGNKMDEEFLVKVNDIIERNISNVDFTMEQLAEELCISSSGLFAKIKSLTSITPNKLLMLVRLKRATELLSENKYRINEVCYMVGFNNPSYFAKCFQKQYDILPKEFVEKLNNTSSKE